MTEPWWESVPIDPAAAFIGVCILGFLGLCILGLIETVKTVYRHLAARKSPTNDKACLLDPQREPTEDPARTLPGADVFRRGSRPHTD